MLKLCIILVIALWVFDATASVNRTLPLPEPSYEQRYTIEQRYLACGIKADFFAKISKAVSEQSGINGVIHIVVDMARPNLTPEELEKLILYGWQIYVLFPAEESERKALINSNFEYCISQRNPK